MDHDRIDGIAQHVTGAVKQDIGAIFGDAEIAAIGAAEREAGTARNARGNARDRAQHHPSDISSPVTDDVTPATAEPASRGQWFSLE